MPKIRVKNYDGEYDIHENVEKVWYSSADEDGVLVPYSYGEAVDLVDDNAVELDFTEGNQTITADDGTLVRSLEIKKPDALIGDNIAYGKEIAGVTGAFIGDTETATVALDFTDSDEQVVEPSAEGKVLSSVTITKPADLKPENIASGVTIAGVEGTFAGGGGGDFDSTDENLKYFTYQLDMARKEIHLNGILFSELYASTGSYNITIPATLGGFTVVICSEGVG